MWPELVKAAETLMKGQGTTGKVSVFRIEPGSRKSKKMEKMICGELENMGEFVNHRITHRD